MNKKTLTLIPVIVIFLMLGAMVVDSRRQPNNNIAPIESNSTNDDQINQSDAHVFYWGVACPFCHDVTDWIEETNAGQKISIIQKEVSQHPNYSQELMDQAHLCDLDPENMPIPILISKDQDCIIGSLEIISFLEQQIKMLSSNDETQN